MMKKLSLILFTIAFAFLALTKTNEAGAQSCPTPPTNTGTVTLSTTTTAGTYRVWSRMKSADTINNSFYLRIDSTCAVLVGDSSSISSSTWTWVDYQNGSASNKINATLTAGNHVITLIGNEPGVSVDKVLLTKNTTCVPTGTSGDNCPAETPTPTSSPDTTPPVISAESVTNITNTGATINWTLNEPASGQVEYGTSNTYGQTSTLQTCCTYSYHIQTLSGLTAGTTYHYRVKSADATGNLATSADKTFTTTGGVISTPTPRPTSTPTPTSAPTPTPTPPITPAPTDTIVHFNSVKLHGIGKGGDNANPWDGINDVLGNQNPVTKTRVATVEVYNTSGVLVSSAQGNIVYGTANGDFSGDIKLSTSINTGSYLVKIKTDKYLKKQLVGIITLTKGTINQMPNVTLGVGDIDGDGFRRVPEDYNLLIDCYSDLAPARNCDATKKFKADLSDDGNVNQDDYNLFLRELSVVSGD